MKNTAINLHKKKIILEEQISVKRNYSSRFIFRSKKKKFDSQHLGSPKNIFYRYVHEVVNAMNGIVSDHLADQIHSLSLTRGFCYLRNRNCSHRVSYITCESFECCLIRHFCRKIVERNDQKYLFFQI